MLIDFSRRLNIHDTGINIKQKGAGNIRVKAALRYRWKMVGIYALCVQSQCRISWTSVRRVESRVQLPRQTK